MEVTAPAVDGQTTSTMETEDKEDITAEILLQVSGVSQEDSQLIQFHSHQDVLSSCSQTSTMPTTCRFSANVPVHCSDDEEDVLQSVRSKDLSDELKVGRGLLLDSSCHTELHDTVSPMETKLEVGTLPLDNTNRGETCSQTESETHITVKSEKVESEDSNSGETRHWVVCQNGVLKEVKVEPTDWTPDTRETSTCKTNDVVTEQENCHTNVQLSELRQRGVIKLAKVSKRPQWDLKPGSHD
ncbi:hypothetical protein LSAT2_009456 [Lamellibrachia satsuma]|nr:hypothetical protein LSAT2_009456 [Lamellibrachia satsuma]